MRVQIIAIIAALVTSCAADRMEVVTGTKQGTYYKNNGEAWAVNAKEGCRRKPIPNMEELCIDWNRQRAHFKFRHQDKKRCLRMTRKDNTKSYWNEGDCTWKRDGAEEMGPA